MQIRLATAEDAQVLADFNLRLAQETEGKSLDADLVLSGVRNGLKQGDEVQYLVAEAKQHTSGQQIVGQLMLTREWSDWRDGWMYWLQSVYVVAEFRGQGVFKGLLESAIQQLKSREDVVGIRLYVEVENEAAIGTYHKMQFVDCGYKVMERLF
ncbi:MAG: N-acetyltransferase [Fuerstiella sp.]